MARPSNPLTPEEVAEARKLRAEGVPIRDICKQLRRSGPVVSAAVADIEPPRPISRVLSPDQIADVRRRVAAGESRRAVAAELGVSRETLAGVCRRMAGARAPAAPPIDAEEAARRRREALAARRRRAAQQVQRDPHAAIVIDIPAGRDVDRRELPIKVEPPTINPPGTRHDGIDPPVPPPVRWTAPKSPRRVA